MTEVVEPCPHCNGRGLVETGQLVNGVGGVGYEAFPCDTCSGTGAIDRCDYDQFEYQHGIDVTISGTQRVVFFDYEGGRVFIWWLPGDASTNGEHLTEAERQNVYEQLCAWYDDWTASQPGDDLLPPRNSAASTRG